MGRCEGAIPFSPSLYFQLSQFFGFTYPQKVLLDFSAPFPFPFVSFLERLLPQDLARPLLVYPSCEFFSLDGPSCAFPACLLKGSFRLFLSFLRHLTDEAESSAEKLESEDVITSSGTLSFLPFARFDGDYLGCASPSDAQSFPLSSRVPCIPIFIVFFSLALKDPS